MLAKLIIVLGSVSTGCLSQTLSVKSFTRLSVWSQCFNASTTVPNIKSLALCVLYCQTHAPCESISYDATKNTCEVGQLGAPLELGVNGKEVYSTNVPPKVPHLMLFSNSLLDYSFDKVMSPNYTISNSWLPTGMNGFVGGPYKKGALICGGRTGNSNINNCNYYQLGSNAVQPKSGMMLNRSDCGIATVKGSIWLAAGITSSAVVDSSELFDIAKDAWVPGPNMPYAAYSPCLSPMDNIGKLYLFLGGVNGSFGGNMMSNASIFDWTTGLWTTIDPMPLGGRSYHSCTLVTFRTGVQRVLVVGGINSTGVFNSVLSLDLNNYSWMIHAQSLPAPRRMGVLVQIGVMVYYMGGSDSIFSTDVLQMSADDPAGNLTWTVNASMALDAGAVGNRYGFIYNT